MNMEQEMKAGLSQGYMLYGSYPKQLDPNIDPQILDSMGTSKDTPNFGKLPFLRGHQQL